MNKEELNKKYEEYADCILRQCGFDKFDIHEKICSLIDTNARKIHRETKNLLDDLIYPSWFGYIRYDSDVKLNQRKKRCGTNVSETAYQSCYTSIRN